MTKTNAFFITRLALVYGLRASLTENYDDLDYSSSEWFEHCYNTRDIETQDMFDFWNGHLQPDDCERISLLLDQDPIFRDEMCKIGEMVLGLRVLPDII